MPFSPGLAVDYYSFQLVAIEDAIEDASKSSEAVANVSVMQ